MNFEDEHYVRAYTRDTKTWLKWGFEGQTVFMHLLRKLDKAGVMDDVDDPVEDVALVTKVPLELVAVGLPRLFESGTLVFSDGRLIMPNYIPAQTSRKSDAVRARESRARRSRSALLQEAVTIRDEPSQSVTQGHESEQNVTRRHEADRPRHASAVHEHEHEHELGGACAPPDPPTPKKPRRPKRGPLSHFPPDDFAAKPAHVAKADKLGVRLDSELKAFRLHEFKSPKSDWDRAFHVWLERAQSYAPRMNGSHRGPKQPNGDNPRQWLGKPTYHQEDPNIAPPF